MATSSLYDGQRVPGDATSRALLSRALVSHAAPCLSAIYRRTRPCLLQSCSLVASVRFKAPQANQLHAVVCMLQSSALKSERCMLLR
eukprot:4000530-Pleurochrysis_carterae.AAC.1